MAETLWRIPERALTENTNPNPVRLRVARETARKKGFGFLKGKVSSEKFLAERHTQAQIETGKLEEQDVTT